MSVLTRERPEGGAMAGAKGKVPSFLGEVLAELLEAEEEVSTLTVSVELTPDDEESDTVIVLLPLEPLEFLLL